MTNFRAGSGKHPGKAYPLALRQAALLDYMSGMRRCDVAVKYSIFDASILSHWKRELVNSETIKRTTKLVKRRNKRLLMTDLESDSANRIKELERALSKAEQEITKRDRELERERLKVLIAETTIDIAEETLNLSIRKKIGSK